MDITVAHSWENPQTTSVQAFVASEIDRASSYVQGRQESTEAEVTHIGKSFAHLVEILASKGMLTAPEVVQIACHYDADPEATFYKDNS